MVNTDLGACEWFVWDLRRSNLMDRGQLDQVVGDFLKKFPRAEPPALAEYLVTEGILSQFQADRLLQGKTQGLVLGVYTLMDALGTGSMGTVYKALSKTDNAWYAVKVLPRRSMWNVRLARRQVRAFEQCQHPGVVPFVDVGTAGGTHYLAWPMVEGETIDKVVQRDGKLEPAVALRYALQAAEALDVCHRHNLIHGLVKPSNLMLGADGRIRILDFGIGSLLSETEGESLVDTMSTANSLTSGLDCACPESILEPTKRTPAGDQYSLGCTLYFMLTGRYPFPEGSTVEKMMAHQTKQPPALREFVPDLPKEVVGVVERLMQKEPGNRFGSVADLVEALRPLVGAAPVPAPAAAPGKPAARAARPVARPGDGSRAENGHSTPAGREAPPRPAARTAPNLSGSSLRERLLNPSSAASPAAPSASPDDVPAPPPYVPSPQKQSLEERIGLLGAVLIGVLTFVICWYVNSLFK
jgi:serine/threonine-protein kinase